MKPKIFKMLCFLLPTICFFIISETSSYSEAYWASGFVLLSLIIMLFPLSLKKASNSAAFFYKYYTQGMAFLSLFLLFTSFVPVGGYLNKILLLEHSTEKAQAIVVFASGTTKAGLPNYSGYQRVLHGFKLLKEQRAPHLFISSGYSSKYDAYKEAEWVASLTTLLNASPDTFTIITDKRITTSATEAKLVSEILNKKNIKKVYVVTSGAHIYRATACFKKLGFEVLPAPTHDSDSIIYSSCHSLRTFQQFTHELLGIIYYKIKGYI